MAASAPHPPPYYAALALFVILELFLPRLGIALGNCTFPGWKDVGAHLLMVFNLDTATFGTINGAFWSLALESQLYLLFPGLVWLAARRGLGAALIATLAVSLVWQIAVFRHLGFSLYWTPFLATFYHALPARCFEFAAGMTAAALVARPAAGQVRWAALTAAVLLVPALGFVLRVSRFGPLCDQAWGVIFACILVLLARVPDHVFERRGLRSLVWLGTISYSVYLIHYPLIQWATPQALHMPRQGLAAMLFDTVRVLAIIALGSVFHRAFERPFMGAWKPAPPIHFAPAP